MSVLKYIIVLFFVLTRFVNTQAQCLTLNTIPEFNCATGVLELTLSVSGTTIAPPYTITSSPAGINTVMTSATITLTNIPYQPSYTFTVYTTTSCFYVGQANYSNPTTPANISITNTQVSCFNGNNGSASATYAGGTGPFTYTWSIGSNNSSVTGLSAGVYTVSITDSKSCTATREFTVTQPAEMNSVLSQTFIPCFGGTISTVITSTGGIAPYSYTLGGNALSSGTTNVSAGIQTILTKDSKACLKTNTILVSQAAQQIISPVIQSPSCPFYSDASISVNVNGPVGGYTYTWTPVNSNSSSIFSVSAGSYSLSVTDASNCITQSVFVIPPSPSISPVVGISKENCSAADGAFTLNISGGHPPFSVLTIPGNSTNTVVSGLSSGHFTTVITDANTCKDTIHFYVGNLSTVSLQAVVVNSVECYNACNGSIMCLISNATSPVTYSVTGLPTATSNVFTNLCAGTYAIKAIDAIGCPALDTIFFATPPVFSYSATPPPVICIGKQANLQAVAKGGTGAYTYIWNPGNTYGAGISVNPTVTTVYSLQVYDSKNCTLAPYMVTVSVNPPLSVNLNSSNSGICPGSTAQITPTVSGGDGNYSYLWLPGGSQSSSIFVENLSTPTFSFYVKDACGTPPVFKEVNLSIFPTTIPAYQSSLSKGCIPLCTEFINITEGTKSVIWNFGDKPFEKSGEKVSYCYDKSGFYNLRMTIVDSNSCKSSHTFSAAIEVLKQPVADYSTIPNLLTSNNSENVWFHNLSGNGSSFLWYVNNYFAGSNTDMYYTFLDTGMYDIKLVVKNQDQCADSVTRSLRVFEGFSFYMPSAFSPNADGLNDILVPKGVGWLFENYSMRIFNKWGHEIFTSHEVNKGWDGGIQMHGYDTELSTTHPNDVYAWTVDVTDNLGESHKLSGTVMLLR